MSRSHRSSRTVFTHHGLVTAFVLCAAILAAPASAAVNAFLKLDGIPGDSLVVGHPNQITVLAFSQGFALPVAAGPAAGAAPGPKGKLVCNGLTIEKALDIASVKLLQAVFTGQIIANGTLSLSKPVAGATVDYYIVKLSNILITSVQQSGSDENPTESVSLTASAYSFSFSPQNPDGSLGTPIVYSGTCP